MLDVSKTYTLPLLKIGADADVDLEDSVSGCTPIVDGDMIFFSKDGYNEKGFLLDSMDFFESVGYIKSDD